MDFKSNVRPEHEQAIRRQLELILCPRPNHSLLLSAKLSVHVPLVSAQISLNIWPNIKPSQKVPDLQKALRIEREDEGVFLLLGN